MRAAGCWLQRGKSQKVFYSIHLSNNILWMLCNCAGAALYVWLNLPCLAGETFPREVSMSKRLFIILATLLAVQ
jgi:hypothetical protein